MVQSREQARQEFSKRLHECLDELGVPRYGRITQTAKMFDVSIGAARKWLDGDAFPDTFRIKDMADKLHVAPDWLWTGAQPKYALSPVQRRISDAMQSLAMMPFDLADACDGQIAVESVEQWLRAAADPTDAQLEIIARPLGRTVDWLKSGVAVVREMGVDRVVYDARGEPVPDNLSQVEINVVRGLRELSSAELDAAVSYIEFMVGKARAKRKKEPRCG